MFKKIVFVALSAACLTACEFDKKPTTADALTATESIPPSILDTTKVAETEATLAVSDKEVATAKQKTEKETASSASAAAKKAAAKKAADEAAKKKAAEAAARKKVADAVKKEEKNAPKATSVPKMEPKSGKVTKNPGAMIPAPAPDANVKKRNGRDDVFIRSEVAPLYPGGEAAMVKYLQKNLKYPTIAKEKGVKGTVFVQFVVEKDGKVDDIVVTKGVDKLLDAEAKRVVAAMPKWAAGQQGGQAVAVQYVLPVKFELIE